MAHAEPLDITKEKRHLGELGKTISTAAFLAGVVAFLAAIVWSWFSGPYGNTSSGGMIRLQYAYLQAFVFYLSLTLGGLFFTMALYITGAKWGIVIRRIPELVGANAPMMAVLSLPIIVPLLFGSSALYEWADAHTVEKDKLLLGKSAWLNVPFFTIRMIIYFGLWSWLGWIFLKRSVTCDETGDPALYAKSKALSAPGIIIFSLTTTFASFDLLMSLTPHWYSTIFGVYYFAGCNIAIYAFTILAYRYLEGQGILARAVTTEHYHDLGKLLFAFVFFWGYIAFSQYMLIWYANLPEETAFYKTRESSMPWIAVSVLLLFGHLLIPFPGLLSRWIKRSRPLLIFWAIWMLVAHWIDHYYIVQPTWAGRVNSAGLEGIEALLHPIHPPLPFVEILVTIGMGGFWISALAARASKVSLAPEKDPYIRASVRFENF